MDKQDFFLKKYGIVLDRTATPKVQNQQMKIGFGVKDIETGDKPYIFVSYSHKDSAVVFPAIKALQEKGYPVWYDDSIRTGIAWRTHIEEQVRDSALVIAFMSENSVASKNCIAEVDHAIDLNLPILTVRLDESAIPSGLNMYLKRNQMFHAYLYNGEDYITRLAAEPFIKETAGTALDAYNAEKRRVAEEAERKRRAAEAQERRRKEAAEAERRRKAEEEAERRRRELEATVERNQRLESLARQRREVEAAERLRREEADAKLRRLEEEQAELERLNEIAKRDYVDPLELEKKYCDAMAELEKERMLRARAESKLLKAQSHIANLKLENTKAKTPESLSPNTKAAKEELVQHYSTVQTLLLSRKYKNYNKVIKIYNDNMRPVAENHRELKPELEKYKEGICANIYRDARICERKKRIPKALKLYHALPKDYGDAAVRAESIQSSEDSRAVRLTCFLFLLYLVAISLMVKFVYNVEYPFWINTLISIGPMIGAVLLWICFNWGRAFIQDFFCVCGIVISALISIFIFPFLYPEMALWIKITASIGYNAAAAVIGCAILMVLTDMIMLVEDPFVGRINDDSNQNGTT